MSLEEPWLKSLELLTGEKRRLCRSITKLMNFIEEGGGQVLWTLLRDTKLRSL